MSNNVHIERLSNGLTVIGEIGGSAASAAVGFFIKTGSRDEVPAESGVSHFLEHMVFKGTQSRSALDITYRLGELGAQANAFTSEEHTVFYSAILPEYLSDIQSLLTEMMTPAIAQAEFDTERGVILEEIALYQDKPHHFMLEQALKDFFQQSSSGNSVLGTHQSISQITSQQMKGYLERRYLPSNMILVAAGDFSWDNFLQQAEKECRAWPSGATERLYQKRQTSTNGLELKKRGINQGQILFLSDSCSSQHEERYPLSILSVILGDSSGSKLYWELVDKGLAESAGVDIDGRDGEGILMVYASSEPANLNRVGEIVSRVIEDALDFSDQELERAKRKVAVRIALDAETPMGRLMSLGLEWSYKQQLTSTSDLVARVMSVTREEIVKALERFPLKSGWTRYTLLPE